MGRRSPRGQARRCQLLPGTKTPAPDQGTVHGFPCQYVNGRFRLLAPDWERHFETAEEAVVAERAGWGNLVSAAKQLATGEQAPRGRTPEPQTPPAAASDHQR